MVFFVSIACAGGAGTPRLADAVEHQDAEAVLALLKERVDVNAAQEDGATALHWAVNWDDVEVADLLIRSGANVDPANDYGVTPLTLACGKGSDAMIHLLLKAGANPNLAQWSGETPLMTCARTGRVDALKLLLSHDAEVNAKTRRGQTALMWAVAEKHSEVARVLIQHGAHVNARSHLLAGFTPLVHITYGRYPHVLGQPDRIDPAGGHLDPASSKGGFTALMFAAQQDDMESARLLLAAHARVNDATPDYGNALVVASASGHEALAIFLLQNGANPNVTDGWGFTPLHYALQEGITAIGLARSRIPTDSYWLRPNMPKLAEALLAQGADPNARVGIGFPPFDYAPFARFTFGSMPQLTQPGATPFLLAAAAWDLTLMRLLVAHGADPLLTTEEGTTPLMVAAGLGRQEELSEDQEQRALEAVRLALDLGGNVNTANRDGRTALHGAALLGANRMVQFLVDQGANLEAKDKYGQTAVSIALGDPHHLLPELGGDKRFRQAEHKTTAGLLLQLGAKPLLPPAAAGSETRTVDPLP